MRQSLTLVAVLIGSLPLFGCPPAPPTEHPAITVTIGSQVLIISGHGFSPGLGACAHLSMSGGQSGTQSIGDPSCSGGAFADFAFPYSYAGCVRPMSTTTVTIIGQDPSNSAGASQTIQIPWDTNCIVAKAGCLNSGASCIACGGEGQAVCSNGGCVTPDCSFAQQQVGVCTPAQPDLHQNYQGGQMMCTANCGHAQGYFPCYSYMDGCVYSASYPSTIIAPQVPCTTVPTGGGLTQYACYDNATIVNNDSSCQCLPSARPCSVNVSTVGGICQSGGC